MTLSANSNYLSSIIVRIAPPVPAGQTTYRKGAFKTAGTLPGLGPNTSITSLFTAHYHNPGPGATLAIELVGVSSSGVRTAPLIITAFTFAPAADAPTLTIE